MNADLARAAAEIWHARECAGRYRRTAALYPAGSWARQGDTERAEWWQARAERIAADYGLPVTVDPLEIRPVVVSVGWALGGAL